MRALPRLVWSEPRAPGPPVRVRREWTLLAALVAIALLEQAARPDLPVASALVVIALMPTVLWRRARPLWMVAIAFGGSSIIELAGIVTGNDFSVPYATVFLLLLPHGLVRWGSGREVMIGLPIVLTAASLDFVSNRAGASETIGGFGVLLAVVAFGAAARYRDRARSRLLEQVKLLEREQFARDLHDTVAHHVSAIAIRAQAGVATSSTSPDAAVEALRVIAAEASRALSEMRSMVRLLRRASPAGLAPTPGITDLHRLSSVTAHGPEVSVVVSGSIEGISPAVSAAVYRLAQESVTNARQHARRATCIDVRVTVDSASIQLRVSDDGHLIPARSHAPAGYGLIGMRERAGLLGGTCSAGPGPERGWTVTAVLPLRVPAA